MTMLFTQIYIYDNNKNIYMLIYKKSLKNVYAFFIKLLATSKQRIRRNSICCLKNQVIFHRVSTEIGLTPPLPVCFHLLFKDPPPPPQQTQGFPPVLRTWGSLPWGGGGGCSSKFDWGRGLKSIHGGSMGGGLKFC